jgi:hypothetical protein
MTSWPSNHRRRARPWSAAAVVTVTLSAVVAAVAAVPGLAKAAPVAHAGLAAPAATATHWTAAEAPLPKNGASLQGYGAEIAAISCPTTKNCVAVGYYTDKSGQQEGLILSKSGTKWTATEAPLPSGTAHNPNVTLTSVSCPSAKMCLIVGRYALSNGAADAGLLLTGSGTSWKGRKAPAPGNIYAGKEYSTAVTLVSAYCPKANTCVAAGTYNDNKILTQGLLLTYTKNAWTAAEAPISQANLRSISCVSATSCTAVGVIPDPYDPDFQTYGIVVTGFGKQWAVAKAPVNGAAPQTSSADLQSVACTTADCTAVGDFVPAGGTDPDEMLLMDGKGTAWSAVERQLPGDTTTDFESQFFHVACVNKTNVCEFTAEYVDGSDTIWAALRLAGSWSTSELKPPSKSEQIETISGLACASATSCAAVGAYVAGYPATYRPMIQQSDGTAWKAPAVPLPANGRNTIDSRLAAVSCPSTTGCVAVGYYDWEAADEGLILTES